MLPTLEEIKSAVEENHAHVVSIRQQIHVHPELSYQEEKTAQLVCRELEKSGIEIIYPVAKTGVIGLLKCKNPTSFCLALRADLDALPIQEETNLPYASQTPNVMHACGHDAHTATLLGVAKVLSSLKENLTGTYKFIFQPSEEKMPSGANAMIQAGALQNPKVDAIFGWHVHPEMAVGEVGYRPENFMASADEIYITINGKGGHAAQPANFNSPLLVAADILHSLESVTNLDVPIVLTFGKLIADGATNVVPEKAEMHGTLRCFDEQKRMAVHQLIKDVCADIAQIRKVAIDLNLVIGYPVLKNDAQLSNFVSQKAKEFVGNGHCHLLPIRMGAEDFAFYSQQIPACFYRVGVGNKDAEISYPIHHPKFQIEEEALKISVGLMSWLAVNYREQALKEPTDK